MTLLKELLEMVSGQTQPRDPKTYIEQRLWSHWKKDPIMPVDVVDVGDLDSDDYDMFRKTVREIMSLMKSRKLSADQAFRQYHDEIRDGFKKQVKKTLH